MPSGVLSYWQTIGYRWRLPASGDVFRARSIARETHASTLLSGLYADVLAELEPWIAALDKKIAEARAAGDEPRLPWLFQQDRYRELERQVRQQMARYMDRRRKAITTTALVRTEMLRASRAASIAAYKESGVALVGESERSNLSGVFVVVWRGVFVGHTDGQSRFVPVRRCAVESQMA